MDLEHINERERYDVLVEIADMYYKQGKTQAEIARIFDTNRFRIAKLLQDALNEHIVEINIKYSTNRNKAAEQELMNRYPLKKAIVVNTQYASQMEMIAQMGKVGAAYLQKLLEQDATIGVTWGKTIYGVVSQLPNGITGKVNAIQLTGDLKLQNPSYDARELVRTVASQMNGNYYYLPSPIYINSPEIRREIIHEPRIAETFQMARKVNIVLSGIGGLSSMPLKNPQVYPYMTERDRAAVNSCIGSIYGYVLDADGRIADIDLNKKVMAVPLECIQAAAHKLVVACGRQKLEVIPKALQSGLFNELLTDSDTAMHILERAKQ